MSLKEPFNQDLLMQAGYAASLAEVLSIVAVNAHKTQTQVSIEQAIIRLLAPFQPDEPQKAQSTNQTGQSTGSVSDNNVYIHFAGQTGTGKSALAARLQNVLISQGFEALLSYDEDRDVMTVVNPAQILRSGEAGTASMGKPDPRNDPNWCEKCQEVHEPIPEKLKDILAMLGVVIR